MLGFVILTIITLVAIAGPTIAPDDPTRQRLTFRLRHPGTPQIGIGAYWLGTDQLGRDLLSRLIAGARPTLVVSVTSVLVAGIIGVSLGAFAGYFAGPWDDLISRLTEVQLAIPYMLLAITVVMILGPGVSHTILVLALQGWVVFARLTRGEILALRERDHIQAARAIGASDARILVRHLLPNVLNSIIVVATLEMANMVIFESSLSFLGLGVPPPASSWGGMLSDARDYITEAWWVVTCPGAAITLTVFAVNRVGDWLRDVADPRSLARLSVP
jgi:peptide/nickel transport system permease protein